MFIFTVFIPGCSKRWLLKISMKGEKATIAIIRAIIVIIRITTGIIGKDSLCDVSLDNFSYVSCGGGGFVIGESIDADV
jgi:hypothetical protein